MIDKLIKGKQVRYHRMHCNIEYGSITSWNAKYVFVNYHTKIVDGKRVNMTGDTSAATDPRDLTYA